MRDMSKLPDKKPSASTSASTNVSTSASTSAKDLINISLLGKEYKVLRKLETFPSHSPPGALTVKLDCTEFTCRCPVTKQPDWATITIEYVANEHIVESKSVKLYLETFRDEGVFHEHLAQVVLDDFWSALHPISCDVIVNFNTRGGIAIRAHASRKKE